MDKIISKIYTEKPEEWRFVESMLEENQIEAIVAEYEKSKSSYNDILADFGLSTEDEDYKKEAWEECLGLLMRAASKKMWRGISREEANALLKAMYSVKASAVRMPNGTEYKTAGIIEAWENANKEEQDD